LIQKVNYFEKQKIQLNDYDQKINKIWDFLFESNLAFVVVVLI